MLLASVCLGAKEDRPVRSGHEIVPTGDESESQIQLKKAIVRRRLVPVSKDRVCQGRPLCSSFDPSLKLLGRAFDEGNTLASLWRFSVWVHI